MGLSILSVLSLLGGIAVGIPTAAPKECTAANVAVCKEGLLKKSDQREYIGAVQCMLDKDPVLPTASYPLGDFTAYGTPLISAVDGYDEYNSHPASHDYEPPSVGGLGLHGGGHATTGLALEDFFASPADPAFMLFRGQVDRLWTLWRGKDEAHCRYAVNGSSAIWYGPQTPDVTMDTYVDFGVMGDSRQMVKMMSPTQNGHYYQYE